MLEQHVAMLLSVASASDRPLRPSPRKAWPFRPPPAAASGLTEARGGEAVQLMDVSLIVAEHKVLIVAQHQERRLRSAVLIASCLREVRHAIA